MYVLYDYPVRDVGALVVVCGHFLSRPGTYLPRQTCVVLACGGATAPAAGCWWLLQARRPCSALCAPVWHTDPCVRSEEGVERIDPVCFMGCIHR